MSKVNATEYAEKWGRRLKASTEDIKRGVEQVTEAPGMKAAAQQELMKTKINESIDNGTWARKVSAVSLSDWKDKILTKGVQRIGAGVDAAQGKQVAMAEKLLKAVDESVAVVNRTPRGTLEDNINRMSTFAREMNKRKLK